MQVAVPYDGSHTSGNTAEKKAHSKRLVNKIVDNNFVKTLN